MYCTDNNISDENFFNLNTTKIHEILSEQPIPKLLQFISKYSQEKQLVDINNSISANINLNESTSSKTDKHDVVCMSESNESLESVSADNNSRMETEEDPSNITENTSAFCKY